MAARKVFRSSVRRGLEEERDSLPALITAVGHISRRFEDFTAQPKPSRDACLAGVEDADVYLLLLGPHYGEPIFDSGLSPTEEEWTVAKRRGLPILVFRKLNADLGDDAQLAFAKRVQDYVTGRFRDTFSSTADLLPKVAEKLRELDQEAGPLVWLPLEGTANPEWIITEEQLRYIGVGPTVELHVLPLRVAGRVSATELERAPDLHGLDCGSTSTATERAAVIGASAWALKAEQVEGTVQLIGLVGGLLADLGFQVCPISADARPQRPSLVVWVCGDETESDEYRQLAAMGVPGLSIGSCVEGLEEWSFITTDELEDRNEFIRFFLDEVAALVDSANVSNNLSNERRRTAPDDAGRTSAETGSDLHQHGRRRTHPDGRGPRSSGS